MYVPVIPDPGINKLFTLSSTASRKSVTAVLGIAIVVLVDVVNCPCAFTLNVGTADAVP